MTKPLPASLSAPPAINLLKSATIFPFFQALHTVLKKYTGAKPPEQIDAAVLQLVSKAITTNRHEEAVKTPLRHVELLCAYRV